MMKWTAVTINLSKFRKAGQNIGAAGRVFGTLVICTTLFFVLFGLAGYVQSRSTGGVSPVSSMRGFAAAVSSRFFMDMVAMEIPHVKNNNEPSSFSQNNVMSFAFHFLTDINAQDPKTLVAREVPGMSNNRSTLLRGGVASSSSDAPFDSPPPAGDAYPQGQASGSGSQQGGNASGSGKDPGAAEPKPAKPQAEPKPPVTGANVAFIYHSHNQESFLPELSGVTDPDMAYSSNKNITLVGERLAERLEKDGVGSVHSEENYPSEVKDFKYAYSYKYSLQTLKEALAQHKDLKYYFDIHRDSQVRGKTTVTIKGTDYAQVYFILGEKNPHWKQNEEFATKIHEVLEAQHPGISKGIHAKGASEGNGEYNQSFSPNSILIEIGGPYNSLEECYRTADVLGDAISQVILNAKKADAAPAK